MSELIKYTSIQEIERITGESTRTIKQWKKGTRKVPESVIRLLRLFINGDASAILGKDWEGHIFRDNLLYVPEWRRGLTPYEIRALFWKCELNRCLKNEIKLLKSEIERRNKEIDTLEIKAAFYKKQLVLESRYGWIIEKSFY